YEVRGDWPDLRRFKRLQEGIEFLVARLDHSALPRTIHVRIARPEVDLIHHVGWAREDVLEDDAFGIDVDLLGAGDQTVDLASPFVVEVQAGLLSKGKDSCALQKPAISFRPSV